MPTYQYRCFTCDVTFEKRQSFSDAPITEYADCPLHHQGCDIRRVVSSPTIVFKGSGFYVTDNKSMKRHIRSDKDKPAKSGDRSKAKSDNTSAKSD
jgi:putative FmdB family regulatory protein